jgi:hypothetical protein
MTFMNVKEHPCVAYSVEVLLLVRLAKLGIEKRDPDTLTDEEKESFARLGKYGYR